MPEYHFVDQPDTITENLKNHGQLGVDTEFVREKTYFAQLCLVQVATPDHIYCVDPLTDNDQEAYWKALLTSSWIVHSARQDIEVILQTTGSMPAEIFDTQVAAGLLGFPAQIGYAGLVKELFDIDMAKTHTRADWTRRPLPEAFLQYAAEDVEFLLRAGEMLGERLDKEGRLDWAKQDSRLLLDPILYEVGGDHAIDRLKGARNFRGRRRAAAVRLALWREAEAIRRNRPRQWILRDNVLLDVAYQLPTSEKQLADIDGMPSRFANRVGKQLLDEVAASSAAESNYQPPAPPDEAQKGLLKELQAEVATCAAGLGLAAETLAAKRELSAVAVSGSRESRVFTGWRGDLIGKQLSQLL